MLLLWGVNLSSFSHPTNLRCEYLSDPLGIDTPFPRLTWLLDDTEYGAKQLAYRILITTEQEKLKSEQVDIWDTGRVPSEDMLIVYNGKALKPFTKYYWQVYVWDKNNKELHSEVATFETGMMSLGNWKGAWISDGHGLDGHSKHVKQAPYFRKVFNLSKPVDEARAYIAVAGLYELYVNGKKVSDHRLDPMFTRFDRRNLYVTYDVTSYLQSGDNAIGVVLGNGWYNHQSMAVWFFDRAPWRDRPAFCMDMRITYADGSKETISTGKDWKTSFGPIVFNSIYTAEHYDARYEQPGWNTIHFSDSKWKNVLFRDAPSQNIVSQQLHPIRNVERIVPKRVTKINDMTYLFDFGKNIAGVTELKIEGQKGMEIRVKHGEMLGEDGRLDMSQIEAHYRPKDDKDPFQTDIYTLKGDEVETFMPLFNYKGFQYAEVTADRPITLTVDNLTAWFMHNDVPVTGHIETSNPLINKIWEATNTAYLSNLFGYATDCPQREKNGWTNDANIAIETGLFNFDGITVYEKWLADHRDAQQPNGVLPCIIPDSGWGFEWANGLDCTSTIAIIPWNIYMFYGDSRLLTDCYESIKRYVDHVTDITPSGLTSWGLGDWAVYKSKIPTEFVASVYYYIDAVILSKAAALLGKIEDEKKYVALSNKIKEAFNERYLNRANGLYGEGRQAEQAMPLHWGLIPEELKSKAAAHLAERVIKDGKHIDVGIFGAKALLNALSDNGYADLAYEVASQKTFPSWGWWIENGATTLYENWNLKEDMSRNHIMFGEISAWFYKALGGIKPDPVLPGYKNILLQPCFVSGLSHASTSYQSRYGTIVSKWKRDKQKIHYQATIPANTTAALSLPTGFKIRKVILGSGETTVELLKKADNVYHLPSGCYSMEFVKK